MTIIAYKIYRFNVRFSLKEIAEALTKAKLPAERQESFGVEDVSLNRRFENLEIRKDELWGTLAYEIEVYGTDIDGKVSKIKNANRYRFIAIDGEREFLIVLANQDEAGRIPFWLSKALSPNAPTEGGEYIFLAPKINPPQIEDFINENHCTMKMGEYGVDIIGWEKMRVSGSDLRRPPQYAEIMKHVIDTPIVRISIPENRYSIAIVKKGSILDHRGKPPEEFIRFIRDKIFPIMPH